MLDNLLLSFLPLFVAFDAPGLLPLYIKFTLHVNKEKRNKLLRDSILTAFFIALAFVVVEETRSCVSR
jgi:multiple antibiotic resistance protein